MMKKLWVALLTMMLMCAMLVGAWAENEDVSEAIEQEVPEVEEFVLGEEPAEVVAEEAAEPVETEVKDAEPEDSVEDLADVTEPELEEALDEPDYFEEEMAVADEAAMASGNNPQPSEDFVIEDGVLIQYVGPGGAVVIPDTVKTIGTFAFMRYDSEGNSIANTTLTSVTIPSTVTAIESNAFQDCAKLKTVIVSGNSLRRIGDAAFHTCSSLTTIIIPSSVETIGVGAFYGCNIQALKLPEYLEEIPNFLFCECSNLKTVSIPKSVKRIGWFAFADCSSLSSITIPDGVAEICGCAFFDCASLTSITIPGTVKRFVVTNDEGNVDAVFGFSGLKSVTIKEGVKIIPESMFYGCDKLTNVTLPETVTEIGDYAFAECLSLSVLKVSKAVTRIGEHTFEDTPSNLQLQVTCNSAAHKYAKAKGIKYTVSGHTAVVLQAVDATCTKSGLSVGVKCSVCGEILSAQKTVAALGHKQQTYKGYDSTCSRLGLTDSVKCSRCGITITPTKVIPTKAHTKQTVKGYAATYTKAGLSDGAKCSVCGTWITKQTTIARKTYPGSALSKKGKNGTITVYIGTPFCLTPKFATDAKVEVKGYKSSKPKIATVTAGGLITPKMAGKTVITVTTANKKVKATVTVKVVAPPPESIKITNKGPVSIKKGKTVKLSTSMTPKSAKSKLKWTSSDKSIATVDKNGKVKAKKKTGTVTITVTTANKKKATIKINVVP